jgi:CxxC-x17-CxxC domain-containing protein
VQDPADSVTATNLFFGTGKVPGRNAEAFELSHDFQQSNGFSGIFPTTALTSVPTGGDNMGFQGEGRGFGGAPREMHKAICGECKKECEVPFKPREDRPVYCKDCFAKRKDASSR